MNPIIEMYHIDCMEYMSNVPDGHFDLAIVDPPYGINANNMNMGTNKNRKRANGVRKAPTVSTAERLKGRLNDGRGKLKNRILNTANCDWDSTPPPPEYFDELFRVSKNQIIWGGNYFDLPPTRCVICWDKVQPWDNFSQWEMAWTSFDRTAPLFRLNNTGGAQLEKKIHPTQKPLKLYKWLLHKFAEPGNKILDTHGGSRSLAIACHEMGFDHVSLELNPEYHASSVKRFQQASIVQQIKF